MIKGYCKKYKNHEFLAIVMIYHVSNRSAMNVASEQYISINHNLITRITLPKVHLPCIKVGYLKWGDFDKRGNFDNCCYLIKTDT